jgi:hypothetical protein
MIQIILLALIAKSVSILLSMDVVLQDQEFRWKTTKILKDNVRKITNNSALTH